MRNAVKWLRRTGPAERWQAILEQGESAAPFNRATDRKRFPGEASAAVRERYRNAQLHSADDTYVLYRIIGNDLPPRHSIGQSLENLRFILENEPRLDACEKCFVVNRIVDPQKEQEIIELLESAGVRYLTIPFRAEEYAAVGWDIDGVPEEFSPWTLKFARLEPMYQGRVHMRLYRHKNNYVMNNNGARNAALRDGKNRAKWVLPWDGNCFVTATAWDEITACIRAAPDVPYHLVPMARITSNSVLLEPGYRPEPKEEPQILFRSDSILEFDSDYFYGRRPKVELFWRLGVPGKWNSWPLEPWDFTSPPLSNEAGAYAYAGWVARLFSGRAHLEENASESARVVARDQAFHDRGLARVHAIKQMLDCVDDGIAQVDKNRLTQIWPAVSESSHPNGDSILSQLRETAEGALRRGPYSVVHKATLPPSRDCHDYWHAAPYFWPNPLRVPGLPYVRRDGQRLPGTRLYEPESENYDRTRLQQLFDDTLVLALAWQRLGDSRFAKHASTLVRTWFLDPATSMNPNLNYAQVRRGHNRNTGTCHGIIEMKDLYFFLDAVRLLQDGGWLNVGERNGLEEWFGRYLEWLRTSPQGREERTAVNNHGTYYDLQVAAIAAYLGESRLVRETLRDSRSRMLTQFDENGIQTHEMRRTMTAHYCCFNLQGWIHLAQLAEACGEDLWSFASAGGKGLHRAMAWLLPFIGEEWPYPQMDKFDSDRFFPIYFACRTHYGQPSGFDDSAVPAPERIKPVFFPHDGVMPFWQFARHVETRRV